MSQFDDFTTTVHVLTSSRGFFITTHKEYNQLLREEGMNLSCGGVTKFLSKFLETGSIWRRPGSGRPTKITTTILSLVEDQMQLDNETTAVQLQHLLV